MIRGSYIKYRVAFFILMFAVAILLFSSTISAVYRIGDPTSIPSVINSDIPASTAGITASQQVVPQIDAVGETATVRLILTYSGSYTIQVMVTPILPAGIITDMSGAQIASPHPGSSVLISYPIRAVQSGNYLITSLVSYTDKGTSRELRMGSEFTATGVPGKRVTEKMSYPEIIKKLKPSVVSVLAYYENGTRSQGSGFFINPQGDVITCLHVINESHEIKVKTLSGVLYNVRKIAAEDQDVDLAKLSVEIPSDAVQVTPIDYTLPTEGEDVLVIGAPEGLEYTCTKGIVSAIRGKKIQIDAAISPGSSGGPVINMWGDAVGIVVSTCIEGQNLNFAIPSNRIKEINV